MLDRIRAWDGKRLNVIVETPRSSRDKLTYVPYDAACGKVCSNRSDAMVADGHAP